MRSESVARGASKSNDVPLESSIIPLRILCRSRLLYRQILVCVSETAPGAYPACYCVAIIGMWVVFGTQTHLDVTFGYGGIFTNHRPNTPQR